jgi:hypothetical protein
MRCRLFVTQLVTLFPLLAVAPLCSSCGARSGPEFRDAPRQDACTPVRIEEDGVDVLFIVDNSGSMREEQASLVREVPRLVRALTTGDRNGDGIEDFPAATSLHVGVVTSDMGSGDETNVRTCMPGLGDDGILRRTILEPDGDCMPSYPSGTFAFMAGDDTAAFSTTIGCMVNLGTMGCGYEQQLEAGLKAMTPTNPEEWTAEGYTPPRFFDPETGLPNRLPGHATGANAGFLRPNSVLTLVLVTDEEDCSVFDYGIFGNNDPRFTSIPANIRCNTYSGDPTIVAPVSRYVNGFLGLRRSPELLVFSAIVGIPPETEEAAASRDFAAVLSHPDMQPGPDASGNMLRPSCESPNGIAYPPVRIVQTAAQLHAQGANVAVTSICTGSFAPAFDALINRVVVAIDACY